MANDWNLNEFSNMLERQAEQNRNKRQVGKRVVEKAEEGEPFPPELLELLDLWSHLSSATASATQTFGVDPAHEDQALQNCLELRRKIKALFSQQKS